MDILTAFATALMEDNVWYMNEDGSMNREYWGSDGAANHIGMVCDYTEGEWFGEDLEEFLNDEFHQEQAMDLATQMMIQTYYKFLKAEGNGIV